MPTPDSKPAQNQLEFIKLKVFLYKYTPKFTSTGERESGLATIDRYNIDLNEFAFFSKYDITNFVASYTFDQTLDGTTYNWSVTLSDPIISTSSLNNELLVNEDGPKILSASVDQEVLANPKDRNFTPSLFTSSLNNLARYESQDSRTDLQDDFIIEQAKFRRGHAEASLTEKATNTGDLVIGLRLSDLIQSYDFVSVYVYKETTPIEGLKGTFSEDKSTFTADSKGPSTLKSEDLRKESILQSPVPIIPRKTLFSNEINGFVLRKAFKRNVSNVDTLVIQGNGITRLFGATRRILKSSLLQDSIYTPEDLKDLKAITAFQSIFAGNFVSQIITDLFRFVYSIRFNEEIIENQTVGTLSTGKELAGSSQVQATFLPGDNFYDLTTLQLGNFLQVNHFTIPPYLLALVMRLKGFNFRTVKGDTFDEREANVNTLIDPILALKENQNTSQRKTERSVLKDNENVQDVFLEGTNPVVFDPELAGLVGYFRFLKEVFTFFNPETKTPFEILDEIKKVTFMEVFERPTGVIEIRNPQYNNTDLTIFSSDLEILDATYAETVEDLITKQKVGYGVDVQGALLATQEFAFTNGKLLLQYGFFETTTDINPNVKNDKPSDNQVNRERGGIIFRYAEFFLRIHNAKLKTGSVTASFNPLVRIGDTFFDEKNHKFGYIVGLTKNVSVGQTATMAIQLSYVRDCIDKTPGEKDGSSLRFEPLPTLTQIGKSERLTVSDSQQSSVEGT